MQFARNPAPFVLLGGKHVFQQEPTRCIGLLDFRGLLALLLAQIGYDHAQSVALVSRKAVQGQMDRKLTAISVTQVEFALHNRLVTLGKEGRKSVSLRLRKQRLN